MCVSPKFSHDYATNVLSSQLPAIHNISYIQCKHSDHVAADFERPPSQEEGNAEQPSTSGSPRPSMYDLIWHATDSSVKPIVANRRIERLPEPKWDARALPFKALVSCCVYQADWPDLCLTKLPTPFSHMMHLCMVM